MRSIRKTAKSPLCTHSLLLAIAIAVTQTADLAELQRRVRADSNDALLHYDLGVELARFKRSDDAGRAFQEAVRIDPQLLNAWIGLYRQTAVDTTPPLPIARR